MTRLTAIMGVDPGTRGAVAVLRSDGKPLCVHPFKPDMRERDLITTLDLALLEMKPYALGTHVCYMEKVGYKRGDGGMGAFTFGKVYGLLRGALLARDVQILDVYPALWQSRLECLTGGNKNISKRRAAEIFPGLKMTHSIADALLIAEYGRRA